MTSEDEDVAERATDLLQRLNGIILDESRRAAPHSCLVHIASSQVYIIVTKIALQCQWQDVIEQSAKLYHLLINSEAEGLLDNKLFSRSLLDLVRYTVIGSSRIVDEKVEGDLIELLFEIATKIRLEPDLLSAWFHPERDRSQGRALQGESRGNQFPLFYVLVQYVHHDGPIGDFARTALLYLTDTASKSKSLEAWMIESDLAPQMASGLGALYSQLSRHFPPLEAAEKSLPILALSDSSSNQDSPKETRQSFQQNMKEFLAYLAFWQDTITHCKSPEVADTLLDHFQVLFVQQLLYPSLLESSDVDGGSTAAVLAHLARILTALENQVLAQRMLRYLLAAKQQPKGPQHRPRLSISRRKSLDHLAVLAEAAHAPSPDLFSLHDLVVMSLRSKHSNTVNACLKLLSIILNKHHPSALDGLFRIETPSPGYMDRSAKTFNLSLVQYFDLAGLISDADTMDASYESTLVDAKSRLERHSCSIKSAQDGLILPTAAPTIAADCKLLESMFDVLDRFFANDTLTNLLLTEAIISLEACGNVGIYGWLLSLPNADNQSRTVTAILHRLSEQVREWRSQFSDWDALLARRREDLIEKEPVVVSDMRPASPAVSKIPENQQAVRTPSRTSQQGSRPTTPRGPPIGSPSFASIDGALSTSPSARSGLQTRPMAGSPLRQSYMPSSQAQQYSPEASSPVAPPDYEEFLKTQVQLTPGKPSTQQEQSLSLLTRKLQAERSASNDSSSLAIVDDGGSGAVTPIPGEEDGDVRSHVSLSHILTNAIILQEFILEVAAVVQVRGTMFGEVDL